MNFSESVALALTSLRTNKLRSLLTLLGVIIGIAAVIAILTLGRSLQAQTMASLDDLGAKDVTLQVQTRSDDETGYMASGEIDPSALITPEMVDDLRARFGSRISAVGVEGNYVGGRLTHGFSELKIAARPVNQDVMGMEKAGVVAGRGLSREDVEAARPVTVVPREVVDELFHGDAQAALGQEVELNYNNDFHSLMVIGVYESKATSSPLVGNGGSDPAVFVPVSLENQLNPERGGGTDQLRVRAAGSLTPQELGPEVQKWADAQYRDDPSYRAKVLDLKKEIDQVGQVMSMMSMALSAIGGISLLVGGIGVMNIMLITVTERTREIGVRKALGARRRDIRMQFVVEAMIICLVGGLLGVLIGGVGGVLGALALGQFVLPPVGGVLVALLFAVAVGLFFGYYPAGKAAKLDPIEALRYE